MEFKCLWYIILKSTYFPPNSYFLKQGEGRGSRRRKKGTEGERAKEGWGGTERDAEV